MPLTLDMFREIDKALDEFEADPAVGLILLEGAGERGLCAGGDIRVALGELRRSAGDLGKILWREESSSMRGSRNFQSPMSHSWMAL